MILISERWKEKLGQGGSWVAPNPGDTPHEATGFRHDGWKSMSSNTFSYDTAMKRGLIHAEMKIESMA
jgi:hypothetical protein